MNGKKKISNAVVVARALALIAIVSAHITFSKGTPQIIVDFYKHLGSLGVVTYLIIAGYYYHPEHYGGFIGVFKNKIQSIGIPWLFLGSVGYAYQAISSRSFSILSYGKFMLGNGSYLYFLVMLFLCFIICFFFRNKWSYLILIGCTILSLELTAFGILDPAIRFLHISNYLNIFNWIGFFVVGVLLQQVDADTLYSFLHKIRWYFVSAFLLVLVGVLYLHVKTGYFSVIGWGYELIGALAIISISTVPQLYNTVSVTVSAYSFTVYLIHFMVIGVLDRVYNGGMPLQLISNLLVITVACVGIELSLGIAKLIKLEKLAHTLLGIRKRKRN